MNETKIVVRNREARRLNAHTSLQICKNEECKIGQYVSTPLIVSRETVARKIRLRDSTTSEGTSMTDSTTLPNDAMTTERLNVLWLDLAKSRDAAQELREALIEVADSQAYRTWVASEPRIPFMLAAGPLSRASKVLERADLVTGPILRIKINRIGERVFITDGAWVSHLLRVFPDPDEALLLIDFARERGYEDWADWVIDPAAGCGHTPLGLGGNARRIACDANVRALLYSRINALLNGFEKRNFESVLNDMNAGFPSHFGLGTEKRLVLTNVPFAPEPSRGALALNSGGGRTGADLQAASFKFVRDLHEKDGAATRACFLTWTVGSAANDEWQVPSMCREVFAGAPVRWTLVDHDYDAPEFDNPAPLPAMLSYLAGSQYSVSTESLEPFENLSQDLEAEGYSHIAYGVLEVELS